MHLAESFPDPASVAVVFTSPLARALQTTTAAFSKIIRKDAARGAQLIIDPDLQERSDLPCDTGSGRTKLSKTFPGLDFAGLGDEWFIKQGSYAADNAAVIERAQRFRNKLSKTIASVEENKDKDDTGRRANIVVVTHGVFIKFLAEDDAIDLPKAGWKAFRLGNREGGDATLLPLE